MKHGSVMGTLMELQDSYVRYLLEDNYHNIILFFSWHTFQYKVEENPHQMMQME